MIKNDEIALIVNTTEGKQAIFESRSIRREAVHKRVTYYTTVAAGLATCDAIAHMNDVDVNRLQDLHHGGHRRASVMKRMPLTLKGAERLRGEVKRLKSEDRPDRRGVPVAPRRHAAEALGHEVAAGMAALLARSPDRLDRGGRRRLAAVDPGDEPPFPTRHPGRRRSPARTARPPRSGCSRTWCGRAGKTVAYSSTDGVYRDDGELVEAGDYSGFGGAARALAQQPDIAVLETARGGMLLRGIGVRHNDVAVVTNVSEDHLGLQGVDTVDQLAEVKAHRHADHPSEGWDVLNADDPRVLAMARHASGRPWLFSARSEPSGAP